MSDDAPEDFTEDIGWDDALKDCRDLYEVSNRGGAEWADPYGYTVVEAGVDPRFPDGFIAVDRYEDGKVVERIMDIHDPMNTYFAEDFVDSQNSTARREQGWRTVWYPGQGYKYVR